MLQSAKEENVPRLKELCKHYILANYNQWDMNNTIMQS
jgi:hypothetical protein